MKKQMLLLAMLMLSFSVSARKEQVEIQGAKGRLVAEIQVPEMANGKKVPMVISCHGFGGDKEAGLLRAVADSLEAHGMASIRFDFNGHGRSEGKFEDMTVLNEIEDAKQVYAYVSQLPYVSCVGMVGHSQGGVVTAMTAAQLGKRCIRAEVLLAPAGVLRDDALRGYLFGKTYNPHDLPERAPVGGDRFLGREYARIAQTLPIYETARTYKGAAYVVHGTWDTIVPYTYGERFHYVIKNSKITLMEKVDHGFSGTDAEVAHMTCEFLLKQLK